jgi:hypothetical protein
MDISDTGTNYFIDETVHFAYVNEIDEEFEFVEPDTEYFTYIYVVDRQGNESLSKAHMCRTPNIGNGCEDWSLLKPSRSILSKGSTWADGYGLGIAHAEFLENYLIEVDVSMYPVWNAFDTIKNYDNAAMMNRHGWKSNVTTPNMYYKPLPDFTEWENSNYAIIDLMEQKRINGFRFWNYGYGATGHEGTRTDSLEVYFSDLMDVPEEPNNLIAINSNLSSKSKWIEYADDTVVGRYLKIKIKNRKSIYDGVGLQEIEIFGTCIPDIYDPTIHDYTLDFLTSKLLEVSANVQDLSSNITWYITTFSSNIYDNPNIEIDDLKSFIVENHELSNVDTTHNLAIIDDVLVDAYELTQFDDLSTHSVVSDFISGNPSVRFNKNDVLYVHSEDGGSVKNIFNDYSEGGWVTNTVGYPYQSPLDPDKIDYLNWFVFDMKETVKIETIKINTFESNISIGKHLQIYVIEDDTSNLEYLTTNKLPHWGGDTTDSLGVSITPHNFKPVLKPVSGLVMEKQFMNGMTVPNYTIDSVNEPSFNKNVEGRYLKILLYTESEFTGDQTGVGFKNIEITGSSIDNQYQSSRLMPVPIRGNTEYWSYLYVKDHAIPYNDRLLYVTGRTNIDPRDLCGLTTSLDVHSDKRLDSNINVVSYDAPYSYYMTTFNSPVRLDDGNIDAMSLQDFFSEHKNEEFVYHESNIDPGVVTTSDRVIDKSINLDRKSINDPTPECIIVSGPRTYYTYLWVKDNADPISTSFIIESILYIPDISPPTITDFTIDFKSSKQFNISANIHDYSNVNWYLIASNIELIVNGNWDTLKYIGNNDFSSLNPDIIYGQNTVPNSLTTLSPATYPSSDGTILLHAYAFNNAPYINEMDVHTLSRTMSGIVADTDYYIWLIAVDEFNNVNANSLVSTTHVDPETNTFLMTITPTVTDREFVCNIDVTNYDSGHYYYLMAFTSEIPSNVNLTQIFERHVSNQAVVKQPAVAPGNRKESHVIDTAFVYDPYKVYLDTVHVIAPNTYYVYAWNRDDLYPIQNNYVKMANVTIPDLTKPIINKFEIDFISSKQFNLNINITDESSNISWYVSIHDSNIEKTQTENALFARIVTESNIYDDGIAIFNHESNGLVVNDTYNSVIPNIRDTMNSETEYWVNLYIVDHSENKNYIYASLNAITNKDPANYSNIETIVPVNENDDRSFDFIVNTVNYDSIYDYRVVVLTKPYHELTNERISILHNYMQNDYNLGKGNLFSETNLSTSKVHSLSYTATNAVDLSTNTALLVNVIAPHTYYVYAFVTDYLEPVRNDFVIEDIITVPDLTDPIIDNFNIKSISSNNFTIFANVHDESSSISAYIKAFSSNIFITETDDQIMNLMENSTHSNVADIGNIASFESDLIYSFDNNDNRNKLIANTDYYIVLYVKDGVNRSMRSIIEHRTNLEPRLNSYINLKHSETLDNVILGNINVYNNDAEYDVFIVYTNADLEDPFYSFDNATVSEFIKHLAWEVIFDRAAPKDEHLNEELQNITEIYDIKSISGTEGVANRKLPMNELIPFVKSLKVPLEPKTLYYAYMYMTDEQVIGGSNDFYTSSNIMTPDYTDPFKNIFDVSSVTSKTLTFTANVSDRHSNYSFFVSVFDTNLIYDYTLFYPESNIIDLVINNHNHKVDGIRNIPQEKDDLLANEFYKFDYITKEVVKMSIESDTVYAIHLYIVDTANVLPDGAPGFLPDDYFEHVTPNYYMLPNDDNQAVEHGFGQKTATDPSTLASIIIDTPTTDTSMDVTFDVYPDGRNYAYYVMLFDQENKTLEQLITYIDNAINDDNATFDDYNIYSDDNVPATNIITGGTHSFTTYTNEFHEVKPLEAEKTYHAYLVMIDQWQEPLKTKYRVTHSQKLLDKSPPDIHEYNIINVNDKYIEFSSNIRDKWSDYSVYAIAYDTMRSTSETETSQILNDIDENKAYCDVLSKTLQPGRVYNEDTFTIDKYYDTSTDQLTDLLPDTTYHIYLYAIDVKGNQTRTADGSPYVERISGSGIKTHVYKHENLTIDELSSDFDKLTGIDLDVIFKYGLNDISNRQFRTYLIASTTDEQGALLDEQDALTFFRANTNNITNVRPPNIDEIEEVRNQTIENVTDIILETFNNNFSHSTPYYVWIYSVDQDGNDVVSTVRNESDGTIKTIRTKELLALDGNVNLQPGHPKGHVVDVNFRSENVYWYIERSSHPYKSYIIAVRQNIDVEPDVSFFENLDDLIPSSDITTRYTFFMSVDVEPSTTYDIFLYIETQSIEYPNTPFLNKILTFTTPSPPTMNPTITNISKETFTTMDVNFNISTTDMDHIPTFEWFIIVDSSTVTHTVDSLSNIANAPTSAVKALSPKANGVQNPNPLEETFQHSLENHPYIRTVTGIPMNLTNTIKYHVYVYARDPDGVAIHGFSSSADIFPSGVSTIQPEPIAPIHKTNPIALSFDEIEMHFSIPYPHVLIPSYQWYVFVRPQFDTIDFPNWIASGSQAANNTVNFTDGLDPFVQIEKIDSLDSGTTYDVYIYAQYKIDGTITSGHDMLSVKTHNSPVIQPSSLTLNTSAQPTLTTITIDFTIPYPHSAVDSYNWYVILQEHDGAGQKTLEQISTLTGSASKTSDGPIVYNNDNPVETFSSVEIEDLSSGKSYDIYVYGSDPSLTATHGFISLGPNSGGIQTVGTPTLNPVITSVPTVTFNQIVVEFTIDWPAPEEVTTIRHEVFIVNHDTTFDHNDTNTFERLTAIRTRSTNSSNTYTSTIDSSLISPGLAYDIYIRATDASDVPVATAGETNTKAIFAGGITIPDTPGLLAEILTNPAPAAISYNELEFQFSITHAANDSVNGSNYYYAAFTPNTSISDAITLLKNDSPTTEQQALLCSSISSKFFVDVVKIPIVNTNETITIRFPNQYAPTNQYIIYLYVEDSDNSVNKISQSTTIILPEPFTFFNTITFGGRSDPVKQEAVVAYTGTVRHTDNPNHNSEIKVQVAVFENDPTIYGKTANEMIDYISEKGYPEHFRNETSANEVTFTSMELRAQLPASLNSNFDPTTDIEYLNGSGQTVYFFIVAECNGFKQLYPHPDDVIAGTVQNDIAVTDEIRFVPGNESNATVTGNQFVDFNMKITNDTAMKTIIPFDPATFNDTETRHRVIDTSIIFPEPILSSAGTTVYYLIYVLNYQYQTDPTTGDIITTSSGIKLVNGQTDDGNGGVIGNADNGSISFFKIKDPSRSGQFPVKSVYDHPHMNVYDRDPFNTGNYLSYKIEELKNDHNLSTASTTGERHLIVTTKQNDATFPSIPNVVGDRRIDISIKIDESFSNTLTYGYELVVYSSSNVPDPRLLYAQGGSNFLGYKANYESSHHVNMNIIQRDSPYGDISGFGWTSENGGPLGEPVTNLNSAMGFIYDWKYLGQESLDDDPPSTHHPVQTTFRKTHPHGTTVWSTTQQIIRPNTNKLMRIHAHTGANMEHSYNEPIISFTTIPSYASNEIATNINITSIDNSSVNTGLSYTLYACATLGTGHFTDFNDVTVNTYFEWAKDQAIEVGAYDAATNTIRGYKATLQGNQTNLDVNIPLSGLYSNILQNNPASMYTTAVSSLDFSIANRIYVHYRFKYIIPHGPNSENHLCIKTHANAGFFDTPII